MEIEFPCGSKGRPEFCPKLCQYGKFCNVKDKRKDVPRGFREEAAVPREGNDDPVPENGPSVELYY